MNDFNELLEQIHYGLRDLTAGVTLEKTHATPAIKAIRYIRSVPISKKLARYKWVYPSCVPEKIFFEWIDLLPPSRVQCMCSDCPKSYRIAKKLQGKCNRPPRVSMKIGKEK